ncbi:aldehyde-activating protein [Novosphingobium sp.]|uniref:GFA family protein n=1 Tax=Novosphingobium sp. TaxID=1874826 RepID=UPI0025CC501B|nr:aldehyde-activating protein [Novosphingobium sp.]
MTSIKLLCVCGAIAIQAERKPDYIFECNCSLCSKTGARWGYYRPDEVDVTGETRTFTRPDKVDPATAVHFCPDCGCTTHFTLTPSAAARHGNTLLGINMWLAEPSDLAGLEVQFPDGRAWSGDGPFGFVREPVILG